MSCGDPNERSGYLLSLSRRLGAHSLVKKSPGVRGLARSYERFFEDFAYRYDHEGGHLEAFLDASKHYETMLSNPDRHPSSIAVHEQLLGVVRSLDAGPGDARGREVAESILELLYDSIRLNLPESKLSVAETHDEQHRFKSGKGGQKSPERAWKEIADYLDKLFPGEKKQRKWARLPDHEPYLSFESGGREIECFRDGNDLLASIDGGALDSIKRKTFFDKYMRKKPK